MQLYSLRWQIELLFKEWKSYCNLRKFNTRNAGIDGRSDMGEFAGITGEAAYWI